MELNKIYNMDCLEGMKEIEDNSVDLVLTDPPYGITSRNEWDTEIDLNRMWRSFSRIIKSKGVIIITASMGFAVKVINSSNIPFRYDLIWTKPPVGFLNANRQPLRSHELILLFSKEQSNYYPQKYGKRKLNRKPNSETKNYGSFKLIDTYSLKYPLSVLYYACKERNNHPTEKPINLFKYLIKSYTTEGNTVCDPFLGSGTTAVACKELGRNFIGFEISKEYCEIARKRVENTKRQLKLECFNESSYYQKEKGES
jgi:site-specific DNA-methyltransferase (adenine-specific)